MEKSKQGYKLVKSLFGKYDEIPEDWEIENLTNLNVKTSSGGTPSREKEVYYTGKNIWIKSGDLENCVLDGSKEKITDDALKNSSAKQFPKNTVLVAMYGATIGKTGILGKKASTNQAICAILPTPVFNAVFLQQFFILKKNILTSFGMGAGQPNISQDLIKNFKYLIPPIKEQQKIASILSNVDNLIDSHNSIIQTTKKLKKGLMQQLLTKGIGHKKFKKVKWLFGKEIEIPEEWKIGKLIDYVKINSTITYGIVQAGPNLNSGISYFRTLDVTKDVVSLDNLWRTSTEISNQYKRTILQENDLIVTVRASVGDVKLITKEFEGCNLSRGVAKISPSDELENRFLLEELKSEMFQRQFSYLTNGTTFVDITMENLRNLKILIPPLNEQQKIESILTKMNEKINEINSKKTNLKKLKKGLMQKLLTGQIRV